MNVYTVTASFDGSCEAFTVCADSLYEARYRVVAMLGDYLPAYAVLSVEAA